MIRDMTTNNLTPIYAQVTTALGFSLEDLGLSKPELARTTPTKRQRHKERQRVNRLLNQVTAENPVVQS